MEGHTIPIPCPDHTHTIPTPYPYHQNLFILSLSSSGVIAEFDHTIVLSWKYRVGSIIFTLVTGVKRNPFQAQQNTFQWLTDSNRQCHREEEEELTDSAIEKKKS